MVKIISRKLSSRLRHAPPTKLSMVQFHLSPSLHYVERVTGGEVEAQKLGNKS